MFMHTARGDSLLGTMRFVSRNADTRVYGVILPQEMTNQALLDSVAYKTYYAIASGAEPLISRKRQKKLDSAISSEESPSKKKYTKAKKVVATKPKPTKKKAPAKADRGKGDGTDFELGVPDEQHLKTTCADEGTEEDEDEENDFKDKSNDGDNDDDGNDGDDDDANDDDNQEDDDMNDDDEETDSDRTESDRIKILMDEEEDDKVTKELYNDVNVNLVNRDADMTNADQGGAEQQNVSKESGFEQVEEDAHVTLTPVRDTQKTDEPVQSSSVSSDFTSKLLNLENPSLADNEIASLMDITVHHEEPKNRYVDNKLGEAIQKAIQTHNLDCREEARANKREYIELVDSSVRTIIREEVKTQLPQILPKAVSDFATPVIEQNVTKSLEVVVLARSSSQPKSTYKAAASLSRYELTKILLDKMEESKSHLRADYKRKLYDALVEFYNTDKDLFNTYGEAFTLKRSRDDQDKDRDPSARSDRGTKRRKSSKDVGHPEIQGQRKKEVSKVDWFKKPKQPLTPDSDWNKRQHVDFRPPQTWISQVARAKEARTSFDELMDTLFDFSAFVLNRLNIKDLTQEILVGPAFKLLKGTCKSLTELEYHLEECSKATIERLDWHNPKGKPYPFDLSKPLSLIPDHRGCQVIPQDFFINNDLEYLKGGDLSRRFAANMTSSKDVYSRKRIITVTRLTIMKKYDYGHLEETELYNLTIDEWYDLNVALRMFTRRIVIQRRVEDLGLGVESYQKKLNLTKPDSYRPDLRNRTAYTSYSDPHGMIYVDLFDRKRLMCTDELHKFSDGMLNDVRTALHDISSGIRMEILPKKKWSNLDNQRDRVMVQDIDKRLFERRLMRNLEKFVGGREYGNDLRLLERTI
ncbi:hypothetical protein Tco_0844347 [Tanacetum coccineum]